ncbi:hypothetical protein H2200_001048 [Cladophialophora chaetospira]|uniref:Ketoreductase domain-containing protein n=1 Tax=Cladophialophora chaetospira TaxID=386627 RepID=A0AA38XK57_9EURO|nr:hypothetical protein H2200_001048 [Cladophialophora chaetospira]
MTIDSQNGLRMGYIDDTINDRPSVEAAAKVPQVRISGDKFEGQVVVITGAAQGIGEVTACLFARQGASIALVDMDAEKAENVASKLKQENVTAEAFVCDIADEAAVRGLVDSIVGRFGQIDVLVHLAGIYPFQPIADHSFSLYQKVVSVNLDGCFLLTRAILPIMQEKGYGRIINTSSNTFESPVPGLSAYVAAKAAVRGFTRVTATEAGPGITANIIVPGLVRTDRIWNSHVTQTGERPLFDMALGKQLIKRHGLPIDVAHTICFIASPEAQFITGQVFDVSGGMTFQ